MFLHLPFKKRHSDCKKKLKKEALAGTGDGGLDLVVQWLRAWVPSLVGEIGLTCCN